LLEETVLVRLVILPSKADSLAVALVVSDLTAVLTSDIAFSDAVLLVVTVLLNLSIFPYKAVSVAFLSLASVLTLEVVSFTSLLIRFVTSF
jgi:hypothetical protein